MRYFTILLLVAFCACYAAPATADWFPGDGYKMHFPQLPDPNGWDVDITTDTVYDDFLCSGTGPIRDIHFWISWKGDLLDQISWIDVSFHGDVPAGADQDPNITWSHPDSSMYDPNALWFRRFYPSDFVDVLAGSGNQGWISPTLGPLVFPNDHQQFYQINIPLIEDPFYQKEGTIYWMGIHIAPTAVGPEIGWKTADVDTYPAPYTGQHFQDDAVYYYGGWKELIDPRTGASLDMAFVITPEPATFGLLLLGILGTVATLRRG